MNYTIEQMKIEELAEVLDLVKKVFDKFEAPDYSKEGAESFYKFANYQNIKNMLNENLRILVAKDDEKIVGMIGFRDFSHISLLFVDEAYHGQGIARNLIKRMKFYCKVNNRSLSTITVNSSPYAVGFYHKIGFEDTDIEKTVDGIRFTPMKMDIYNFKNYTETHLKMKRTLE